MKRRTSFKKNAGAALALAFLSLTISCSDDNMPNVEPQQKTITAIVSDSSSYSLLKSAVVKADLAETLSGTGPFTVFAPTNEAFSKLPAGTVETLLKPENIKSLQTILTYHVVAGKMNSSDIAKAIKAGKGKASLKTVSGGTLTAWMDGKDLYISDESGNKAKVTISDVNQSNGIIHVVDTVLLPKM